MPPYISSITCLNYYNTGEASFSKYELVVIVTRILVVCSISITRMKIFCPYGSK